MPTSLNSPTVAQPKRCVYHITFMCPIESRYDSGIVASCVIGKDNRFMKTTDLSAGIASATALQGCHNIAGPLIPGQWAGRSIFPDAFRKRLGFHNLDEDVIRREDEKTL